MKTQQYLAGVLLIALLVAGAILVVGNRLSAMMEPQLTGELQEGMLDEGMLDEGTVQTAQLPSAGTLVNDFPLVADVKLTYATAGDMENPVSPTEEELANAPDLGSLQLTLMLQKLQHTDVMGFVDLNASLVFTGHHTIDLTMGGATSTITVGPKVTGYYEQEYGLLYLDSERFTFVTETGDTIERQFRLTASPGATPGTMVGAYYETVWVFGLEPVTVFGDVTFKDLSVTLARVNQPPVVAPMAFSTAHNTAAAITLKAVDPEGSALAYVVVSSPSNGTLSGTAPNFTYTPNNGYAGSDSFTFKANDGALDSTAERAVIVVNAATVAENRAPTAIAQTVNATTAQARSITLTGSDPDNNALTYVVVSQPGKGTLSGTAPNLTYTSAAGFVGTDSFTFKVNDGKVDSAVAMITLNVTAADDGGGGNTNNAPTATALNFGTSAGASINIVLAGSDADNDSLTYIIVAQPVNGTLSGTAPNLTYTPNVGFVGTDSFTYKVNDGKADSAEVTVTILVDPTKIYLPLTSR